MATNMSQSEMDYTCPVCCDIFTDPIVLLCGHSFCKSCIQEWWRQSTIQKCPVCKEIFPMSQPPPNLALRNLSDNKRQERSDRAMAALDDLCSVHGEKFKLFCQDDEQLICVICRDAQQHKKHNCIPINEAAESQKTKLKVELMHLKSKLGSFEMNKLKCDKMAGHIKFQAQQTEKTIKEEFQKLHKFLKAEETARINAVRDEGKLKSDAMSIRIVNLSSEISSLRAKIQTIEREIKAEDFSFMRDVKSILKQGRCNLPGPETPSGALIDEAKHVGNLLFTVLKKMTSIIQYSPVILNPNTGCSSLTLSQNLTCSESDKAKQLPENPERRYSGVLGYEGFSSGKHSWDVEVDGWWGLGVTDTPSVICGIAMHTETLGPLCELHGSQEIIRAVIPKKVRVLLDYNRGLLTFFDLDRKTHVHTIKYRFTQTVFPYFNSTVKILPAELAVRIKQPR